MNADLLEGHIKQMQAILDDELRSHSEDEFTQKLRFAINAAKRYLANNRGEK